MYNTLDDTCGCPHTHLGVPHILPLSPLFGSKLCPVPPAHFPFSCTVGTAIVSSLFGSKICPMPQAEPPFLSTFGTVISAALLDLRPMRDPNSSSLGKVGTGFVATHFPLLGLRPMLGTDSSLSNTIGTAIVAALLALRSMLLAESSS